MFTGRNQLILISSAFLFCGIAGAQISPGDLAKPHEFLEGVSNCTKCHTLGNKITGGKCLDCHTEILERIRTSKGYHSSSAVRDKQCIECHSDHHGKNFQLVRLNTTGFDHALTGFTLSKPHSVLACKDCHKTELIKDQKIRNKQFTYLGVGESCLTCHSDYHLGTLSPSCLDCHGPEAFKTAPSFSHDKARFRLLGKHRNVDCIKCHKIETVRGNKFQEFRGVAFASCVNCHKDPHNNKFGQDCAKCHSEVSFTTIKGISKFDHNKTGYPLEGMHLTVDCRACHKTNLTDPLKYNRCTDCHQDYHKGQFTKNGNSPDCAECHSVKGFTLFTYTVEQHNKSQFPLNGAHAAQPCTDCHKKQKDWSFRGIGTECRDCHPDIHKSFITAKYFPDENCRVCHVEQTWKTVSFDHSKTDFPLTGAHINQSCASCHITRTGGVITDQRFAGLGTNCTACHKDIHLGQFDKNGSETCRNCHVTENWKPSGFDHSKTAFMLDGKHVKVPCSGCHKPVQQGQNTFILYKIKDFRCESCHL